MTEVNFNAENCTSMGSSNYPVFESCTNLKTINIGNSVKTIPNYAFEECSGLTSVTIPNSVTEIGEWAFSGCSGLTELIIEDGTETLSLGGNDDYEGLFYDCPIEKLYLGRNLSYYTGNGISPFYNNAKLKKVTIGNSVTEIGHYAFSGCEGLTSITIPNSVVRIRYKAFEGCDGLTSIIIPNSVTEIGNKAFYGCKGLTKVTIPNSVTEIGDYAFYNTGWYNNQPDGILYLDNCCLGYKGSKPTGSLLIKKDTRLIGSYAFSDCSGLTSVTIPNSVTKIGNEAFSACSGLTEVNISDLSAWCKIGFGNDYANPLCYAKKLKLNETEITNLVIPNDISQIKDYAFSGCKGLTSVTIPNSVTEIGNGAFYGCDGLIKVTIGNSVTEIGNSAFSGCSLRLVQTLCMTPPACGTCAFDGCYSALLMIPEGTMVDYALADEWCNFTKVQEGVTTGVEGIKTEDNALEISRYDIHGRLLSEPTKGINILKMSDGTTRTELVK